MMQCLNTTMKHQFSFFLFFFLCFLRYYELEPKMEMRDFWLSPLLKEDCFRVRHSGESQPHTNRRNFEQLKRTILFSLLVFILGDKQTDARIRNS